MNTNCIKKTSCDWWWCKTNDACLLHQHSQRKAPIIRDSDSWDSQLEKLKNIKARPNVKGLRCINIYCGTLFNITQHHLIPNPYRKGVIGGGVTVPLCEKCHRYVHWLRTNKELALNYNTKESIIELLGTDVQFRANRIMNSLAEEYQYKSMVA